MSHDDHNKEPIIMTSGARIGKGLLIVIATMAVGAGILIPSFNAMYSHPPPVTQIRTEEPEPEPPAEAGTTTISMLQGAATQGAPDYDPDPAEVPQGNKIVWHNKDNVPHTATSGTGPDDANSGKAFDTGIINGGESSKPVDTASFAPGDAFDYYCMVHPYMKGKFTIAAKAEGGTQSGGAATHGSPTGGTINILKGAAVQGSPDFDPEELTIKSGQEVHVVNQDTLPHTVTSGTGPDDANSGKAFDTSILEGGATFDLTISNPGDYDYYCMVHPYMKGKLTVQ